MDLNADIVVVVNTDSKIDKVIYDFKAIIGNSDLGTEIFRLALVHYQTHMLGLLIQSGESRTHLKVVEANDVNIIGVRLQLVLFSPISKE